MRRLLLVVFVLALLGGCAKNGEYRNCDFVTSLRSKYPDTEICMISYYENDNCLWKKTYVNDNLVEEEFPNQSKYDHNYLNVKYNLQGDTLFYQEQTADYDYRRFRKENDNGKYDGYEKRVSYRKRRDEISELVVRYDKDNKLILNRSGCKYVINRREKWCDCPKINTDKFLSTFLKELAVARQQY